MANSWLRRLGYGVMIVILCPIAYFAAAFGLGTIAVTPHPSQNTGERRIDIAVMSNGVHTDIIVPANTPMMDWREHFSPNAAPDPPEDPQYIAVGWGHRGFYLNTPTWAELKLKTALSAILGIGRTVLHVTFLEEMPTGEDVVWVRISPDRYADLVLHIRQSIVVPDEIAASCATASDDPASGLADDCYRAPRVAGHSYFGNDAFFEARGSYNLFYTCNSWTRDGLAAAGLTVPLWSPFADAIMHHLGNGTDQ